MGDNISPKNNNKQVSTSNRKGENRGASTNKGEVDDNTINPMSGRWRGINRERGYNSGRGEVLDNTFRNNSGWNSQWDNRERGYDSNWMRGRNRVSHNNSFHKPRMINTGPASAFRAHKQLNLNSQDSVHPFHSKTFSSFLSEFNPVVPPPPFNSQIHGYLQPPQFWVPSQFFNPMLVNNMGPMHNCAGGISASSVEANHNSQCEVNAQMSYPDVLTTAMAGLELTSSQELQSLNNNDRNEAMLPNNQGSNKYTAIKQKSTDEAKIKDEVKTTNKDNITSVATNPLFDLGQSLEQDQHLLDLYSGIEMRPSTPFPPNHSLQYFYIPYGTPPPKYVIPVMVFHAHPPNETTENKDDPGNDEAKSEKESINESKFPPSESLLLSFIDNLDLPSGPLTPLLAASASPVEIYQPAMYPWPHQFMMDPMAMNPEIPVDLAPQDVFFPR